MGHAFRRCNFKVNIKSKRISEKNKPFSGLLFFLSILEAGVSTLILAVYCSIVKKQDSRCRHTYVYIVHKVSYLSTTLYIVGSLFKRYIGSKATKGMFQALCWQDQLFLNISVANVKLDFKTY